MMRTRDIRIAPGGEQILLAADLAVDAIFHDPRIQVWRDIPERQNCTLNCNIPGASRLHIKRFKAPHGKEALQEAGAIGLLQDAGIATVPLVAAGAMPDGTGFLISADLAGYEPADRVLQRSADPGVVDRIADLALKLHASGLHHRDLYLCHFFVKAEEAGAPIHLIDPGRVARLPYPPFHYRWIVKDLAQLCYSVTDAGLPSALRGRILARYLQHCSAGRQVIVRGWVPLKESRIARHDRKNRQTRPERRVSLESV